MFIFFFWSIHLNSWLFNGFFFFSFIEFFMFLIFRKYFDQSYKINNSGWAPMWKRCWNKYQPHVLKNQNRTNLNIGPNYKHISCNFPMVLRTPKNMKVCMKKPHVAKLLGKSNQDWTAYNSDHALQSLNTTRPQAHT